MRLLAMDPKHTDDTAVRRAIDALRGILPAGVLLAGGVADRPDAALFDDETRAIAKAVAQRQREFRAGRAYARDALRELGLGACAIPVGRGRAPVWPDGVVGSISHTRDACAVVVARTRDYAGLGLDIESAEPLDATLVRIVCREGELSRRASLESRLRCDLPKLLFVTKESVYKVYQPLTGCVLEFPDVDVELVPGRGEFSARIVTGDAPGGAGLRSFTGRFGMAGDFIYACVTVPVEGRRQGLSA